MAETLVELVARISADSSALKKALSESEGAAAKTAKSIGQKMDEIGQKMSNIGKQMSMKLTAPIVGLGTAAFKMAGDFDQAFRKTNVMLGASAEEAINYKKRILEISSATGKTAGDVADAFYQIVSAGYRGADSLDILETAIKGAVGGAAQTESTMAALTKAMNIFGMEGVGGATKAMDIFFGIVDTGLLSFEQMASAFPQAASSAAGLGVSIEEVGAALGTLSKVTGSTDDAATALNNTFMQLISPSDKMKELYAEWGVKSGPEAIQAFGGLSGVLAKVAEATGGNVDELAELFPSIRALKAVLPLVTTNADDYAAALDTVTNSSGRTSDAFDEMAQGPGFQWNKMMVDLQNSTIKLGDTLATTLGPIIEGIGGVVEKVIMWWQGLDKEWQNAIIIVAGVVAALGPILLIVGQLSIAIAAISGPIGIAIIAIVALSAAGIWLWQNWNQVSHFFSQMWYTLEIDALNAVDKILEALQSFAGLIPWLDDKIGAFRDKISNMVQAEKVKKDLNEVEYNLLKSQKAAEKASEENDGLSGSFGTLSASAETAQEKVAALTSSWETYIQRASNVEGVITAFDEAKNALDDYTREWDNWIEKAKFADSTAGQLNITFNDVKNAFIASGHSLEEFEATLRDANVAVGDINGALEATEISALDAGRAVGKLTEAERKAQDQADDLKRAQERLIESWNDFEQEISSIAQVFRDTGLSNEQIIRGWAAVSGRSTSEIINDLASQEIAISDLNKAWYAVGIPLAAIREYYAALGEQGEKTAESLEEASRRIADSLTKIASQSGVSVETARAGWQEFIAGHAPGGAQLVDGKWVWPEEFESGGIVPGPIGAPQMAIVHGGETIIPANESMGNVILNISGPLFMEREDQMNQFVDKISKTLDRKYRLRFGGAYGR